MSKKSSKADALRKAFLDLNLNLLDFNLVQRDSLSLTQNGVTVHEVDRTPVLIDPELGTGRNFQEKCFFNQTAMDIGGKASTNNEGKLNWKLTNFICEVGSLSVSEPVSFVATPRSNSPVFLTSNIVSTDTDLVIDVFSWDVNGNPAPRVRFAWRCWVNLPIIID